MGVDLDPCEPNSCGFEPICTIHAVCESAQTPDRITVLENFGNYGEPLFVYVQIANILDGSFLIIWIFNPRGDLRQIRQLMPLSNGAFVTYVFH